MLYRGKAARTRCRQVPWKTSQQQRQEDFRLDLALLFNRCDSGTERNFNFRSPMTMQCRTSASLLVFAWALETPWQKAGKRQAPRAYSLRTNFDIDDPFPEVPLLSRDVSWAVYPTPQTPVTPLLEMPLVGHRVCGNGLLRRHQQICQRPTRRPRTMMSMTLYPPNHAGSWLSKIGPLHKSSGQVKCSD